MGTFDSFADAPGGIRIEGEQITLRFDRTGPNTGRVSWNIPPPAAGCTSDNQAYCGMLVTIDTIPASRSTAPVNSVRYEDDATADTDLFAGDTIGTSHVIGAFYEEVEKGTGQEFTTFFDVSGLDENTTYFVAGYAVDCVIRYHTQGVFAYSQALGREETEDTSGHQCIKFDGDVELTDGTGLKLGKNYSFLFTIDGTDYSVTINGDNAQTIQQLIDAINDEIEQLTEAPSGPLAPNTGAYWYDADNGKLFQWDGTQNVRIPVLNEPTDPTALAVGDYWYDTDDDVLSRWDGTMWVPIPSSSIISFNKDLFDTANNLTSEDFWYQTGSPTRAFSWCGNVWCERTLFDQEKDPTCGIDPNCGTYWFNTDDELLRQWNDRKNVWQETNAIYWDINPSATGSPSLLTGTFWFDETNQELNRWSTPVQDMWTNVALGYQDVSLAGPNASPNSHPYALTDLALVDGTYTDDIEVNGETFTVTLEICNATEGEFGNVFDEINKQLKSGSPATAATTVGFRDDGLAIRLLSSVVDAPEIQAGGNLFSSITDFVSIGTEVDGTPTTVGEEPESPVANQYWVDTTNENVFQRNAGNTAWDRQCSIFFPDDPTDRESCDLWWNSDTDILSVWDAVGNTWVAVDEFIQQEDDPAGFQTIEQGDTWYQPSTATLFEWDGSTWIETNFVSHPTDPTMPATGDIWRNTGSPLTWFEWDGTEWVSFDPVDSPSDPSQSQIDTGTFWYDNMNMNLFMWNGTNWVPIAFSTTDLTPEVGDLWYDTSVNELKEWNGTIWAAGTPIAIFFLSSGESGCSGGEAGIFPDEDAGAADDDSTCALCLQSTTTGSSSKASIDFDDSSLFDDLTNATGLCSEICGEDGLESLPSYAQIDVGTDGSSDERRDLDDTLRRLLGYPVIEVELDKEQMNLAIDIAIEELRRRSASGYRRGFMKLNIHPGTQRYQLSNAGRCGAGYERPDGSFVGYRDIVQVMGVFRVTSAFMTSAHGSGVFGQVVLQHLYNMGTFDLLSFHLVSEYIEQLEHLFASRMTFNWNETDRVLWLHQAFSQHETALMDVAVERTEQDLITDRFTGRWIEAWALAQAKLMLSQIRGKYSTLPGAGGGVTLNAVDLQTQAQESMEELVLQIDNYQVNNVEEYGQNVEFIIG